MALSNDTTLNCQDCIANNIPSRAFRYATESKNVLSSAGAMYVGTGLERTTTITYDGGTALYDSYITAVLDCPQDTGYTLQTLKVWFGVRGGWAANISYKIGDIVYYSGKFYRCKNSNTPEGTYPTDNSYWDEYDVSCYVPCWVKGTSVSIPHRVESGTYSYYKDINEEIHQYIPDSGTHIFTPQIQN